MPRKHYHRSRGKPGRKKKWNMPVLTVLKRGKDNTEKVLSACKRETLPGGGAYDRWTGCAGDVPCEGCSERLDS